MRKLKSRLATSGVILWQHSANRDGKHPVRVRVTYNREARYYPVSIDGEKLFLSVAEFDEIHQNRDARVRGRKRAVRDAIDNTCAIARDAIERVMSHDRPFTWDRFESEFRVNDSSSGFLALFAAHLNDLRNGTNGVDKSLGSFRAYNNAFQAFKKFRKDRELSPFDLTVSVLQSFRSFLGDRGCGETTVAIYARALRVIYNLAADKNPALMEHYPFARKQNDKKRFKIDTGSGKKGEALTEDQLKTFMAVAVEPFTPEHEAKLLWELSFRCAGMNMKDIFHLKYENIRGNAIRYIRRKTKTTKKQNREIVIPMTPGIQQIIVTLGNPDKRPDSYVFPVIPNGLASTVQPRVDKKSHEERIDDICRQKIKMVNQRLKSICKQTKGLDDVELTTYWARHSFATLLKKSGTSVEMIRELLGHSDVKVTESYLKRFDDEAKTAAMQPVESILKVS